MNATLTEIPMKSDDEDIAYQVRCKRSWMDRVTVAAKYLGLSPAAYIRMAVTQRMDADGVAPSKPPEKKKPK